MRAAVRAAREQDAPPPVLELKWECLRWGVLPKPGGMGEQDYQLMYQMKHLDNVYSLIREQRASGGKPLPLEKQRAIFYLMKSGVMDD